MPVPAPAAPTAMPAGSRIGQYEVIRTLGRGGMGHVYLARDVVLGRRVAIKFLLDQGGASTGRVLAEARATASCQHENIVVVHDVDVHEGHPFIVLEYLEGHTLTAVLERGPLAPDRAIELITPLARALAHAHAHNIVHRDLKPDNVLVTAAGMVKVLDFGIAAPIATASPGHAGSLTGPAVSGIVGTPAYMAPEQLRGEPVDARADLWAVGVMLYELVTCRHPFGAELANVGARVALDDELPRAAETAPELPAPLAALIDRCLAPKPTDRPASAVELLERLEALAPDRRASLAEGECPYPGLAAFGEHDADRFFGRAADVRRAVARLAETPLIGVLGPSGVGKSSFVRAGLAAALRQDGDGWDIVITRPGRDPLAGLAELARGTGEQAPAVAHLRAQPGALGAHLRERARQTGRRVLLFVDQFEELYTLARPEDRAAYVACLGGVADDVGAPLRLALALRADFTERLAESPGLLERLTRGLIFLGPIDRAGLRDALIRPAAMAGHRFESVGLVDEMVDAVEGAPGALPLLQFAAARLWDGRDREARTLTEASYRAMGGIAGAIAQHADQVIGDLPGAAQREARDVFRRLVTDERTRALVDLAELRGASHDPDAAGALVDQLVRARLLVLSGDADTPTVELVHESLITRWPRLARWIDEEHDLAAFEAQLRAAARPWDERGRPSGLLWRDDALAEARLALTRLGDRALPPRERAFLDAALAADARARRTRRLWTWTAFLVLAAIAAGAVVALLWVQGAEREGRRQADRAREEAVRALQAERDAQTFAASATEAAERARTEQASREAAEAEARGATAQVVAKDQDLAVVNQQLEAALDETRREAARTREALRAAEHEATRAHRAEVDVEAKRRQLEVLLGEREAQVRRLEQQLSKITTDLK